MLRNIPERDWKEWRKLSASLLERFCAQTLDRAARFATGSDSAHDRYVKLFQYLKRQDRKIAMVFDNPRRSAAYEQIAAAVAQRVMSADELSVFTEETRNVINLLLGNG
jgi:hypothetical protein